MTREEQIAIAQAELAKRERGRRSFVDFVPYVNPLYQMQWFHHLIATKLDQVEKGNIKKLALFMPPQHGKSELASRLFPAYAIGKNSNRKIAITSYAADLAEGFNKKVQNYISSEEYQKIFPKIRRPMRGEATATGAMFEPMILPEFRANRYKRALGYVLAVGVGGGITGKTVDIAIIDDPIKGRENANSVSIRDKVWDWYVDEVQSRLHNDAAQILIQTRWHEDDLAGRVLSKHGLLSESNPGGWDVVVLPALKTKDINSYDPREFEEALWTDRHNKERILAIKADSIVTFDSLYQQDPKPNTDTLVYPNWREIPEFPDEKELDAVFYGLDFGFSNDPTALVKIGKSGRRIYLDEIIYEWGLGPHALRKRMLEKGVRRDREIFADHAPAIIHDLKHPVNDQGLPLKNEEFHILKAEKAIEEGISTVKEFEIFYTSRSLNIKQEKNKYAWKYVGGMNTNEPIDAWNHCFTGDTLITTKEGQKRIDKIRKLDFVLTSAGWRGVNHFFSNGRKRILVTRLIFCDFEIEIKATPDHKFKTTIEWKELNKLKAGDILYTCKDLIKSDQNFALENVLLDIQLISEYEDDVYDIEVDDMHEYFANGILVSNCMDSIRYGLHTKYRRMSSVPLEIIWSKGY